MTDYLEEHLEYAGALLEQLRQMERSTAGPFRDGDPAAEEGEAFDRSDGETYANEGEKADVSDSEKEVDALKREVNQMKELAANANLAPETGGGSARDDVDLEREEVYGPQTAQPHMNAAEEGRESARSEAPPTNEEKAGKNSVPLAVQLEELDHAVSALAAIVPVEQAADRIPWITGGRRGTPSLSFPSAAFRSGEAGGPGSGVESASFSAGDGLRWAEQADRVFRRDSRRYDGGFYLY